jgi:multicomponent Na+:H+ antiporter subunit C
MAYRSWQLTGHDDVQDDVEDATIRRLAAADEASDSYDLTQRAGDEDDLVEPAQEEGQPR